MVDVPDDVRVPEPREDARLVQESVDVGAPGIVEDLQRDALARLAIQRSPHGPHAPGAGAPLEHVPFGEELTYPHGPGSWPG